MYVYPRGKLDKAVASVLFQPTGELQLPPGAYDIVMHYTDAAFDKVLPPTSLEIVEGQLTTQTVNLNAGRIVVTVEDALGQPTKADRLVLCAYAPGQRDVMMASALFKNPRQVIVSAGITVLGSRANS